MTTRKVKQAQYARTHYINNSERRRSEGVVRRRLIVEQYHAFKGTLCCSICNENDPVSIDFHHLDPSTKEDIIHRLVRNGRTWSSVILEIEKCVALCANCHRKVHAYEEWAKKINETHLIKVPAFETVG